MIDPEREKVLRRVRSPLSEQPARIAKPDGSAGAEALTWDEMGFVWEGVSFVNRALFATTHAVTRTYDLGPRGAWMLNLISHGIAYPLDVARMLCTGRSLITAELKRLTDAGLVTTKPGEHDRRRTELTLTPAGQAACQQIRDEMSASLARNLAVYSADEIRLFGHMLRDLRRGTDNGVVEQERASPEKLTAQG